MEHYLIASQFIDSPRGYAFKYALGKVDFIMGLSVRSIPKEKYEIGALLQ